MERDNLVSFIQAVIPMPTHKVLEIAAAFQPLQLMKDDYFIQPDKICNKYLYLENGMIRAFTFDLDGNEVTTEFYSSNQIVFEIGSFFQNTVSKEAFQALENSSGWFINYEQLQTLFHSVPEFREFGRMILVRGYISFKQRTLSLINETAEQRYETLINSRPEICRKAPLKHIASYLGITDTSLSRIRKDMFAKK